jgi:hypothetical protein
MRALLLLFAALLISGAMAAQASGMQKVTHPKRQHYIDSLKQVPYPYSLPFMGAKMRRAGIILPLPHGVMVNYLQGTQLVEISNLKVGFNNAEPLDLSQIVQFEQVQANMVTPHVRIDTWILPFWNVSAIAGYAKGDISVHLKEPVDFETKTTINGAYYSVGTMFTGAIGPVFLTNDYTYTWNFNDKLTHPATIFMTGVRSGPVWRFPKKIQMNFSAWIGFTYSLLNSKTDGSVAFSDIFPDAGAKLDEREIKLDNWYTDAYSEAKLPKEKEVIQELYDKQKQGISNIRNKVDAGSIQYNMNKGFNNPFAFVTGIQWQISDIWQLRFESQYLGDRKTFMASINYRFGIRKSKEVK